MNFSLQPAVPIVALYLQEIPVSGIITLTGVLLKLGGYFRPRGLWRWYIFLYRQKEAALASEWTKSKSNYLARWLSFTRL